MKLAIVIDVDGDIMYVPEGKVFPNFPEPKLFDNMEDAEAEREKWNTGVIIDYETGKSVNKVTTYNDIQVIREFDGDERQRAKERAAANKGNK